MNISEILIIGGGHASLPVITSAFFRNSEGINTTLINDDQFLYYSGMIPQFLADFYDVTEARIDLKKLCKKYGVRFIEDSVESVIENGRTVQTRKMGSFKADVLLVNIGALSKIPDDISDGIPVKPFTKLIPFKSWLSEQSTAKILILGGGAAGTEIALNLSHIKGIQLSISERGDRLIPQFPVKASKIVHQRLTQRDVYIYTNSQISEKDYKSYDKVIFAIGNKPSSNAIHHPFPTTVSGRIECEDTLIVKNHPHVFAAGDVAFVGKNGFAPIGIHAVKQGFTLRDNIENLIQGKPLEPYKPYPVHPLILSDGPDFGLLCNDSLTFSGRSMAILKYMLDNQWMESYSQEKADRRSWLKLAFDAWRKSR